MSDSSYARGDRWLLPDAVEELLPPRAMALERLRQRVLETCTVWGYELVMPPTIEYLDSLLTGAAHDLDLQTFKITDQLSGRMMGVRADITPQAARIDAHQLRRDAPVRLCYTGTVLRTRPEGLTGSRNPLQVGAELYGHAGVESDIEVIALMAETLRSAGVGTIHVDLGHVGIFRGLARQAGLGVDAETELWDALQRKAAADIAALIREHGVSEPVAGMLSALPELTGGVEVLDHANERLAAGDEEVHEALRRLWSIAGALERWLPDVALHFDLGELRGYRYHTGVVFAAFVPGWSQEIARGGRYDEIGAVFGRPRPATGFSADLKAVLALADDTGSTGMTAPAVGAPWVDSAALFRRIAELRGRGERVLWLLPGHEDEATAMGCDRVLARHGEDWVVQPLD
ncbi:ATP phosphoribosyltransferase regulatory subunit [Arhodomonas sp. SL1]|uniref:ATP phosphoribosyltransferase regulatory subunit n=1 Tax=Arhodomonas sp. SL1 TaxID=3425691 RepID=UPI003F8830DA